jgi:hypothetical protein
MKKYSFSYINDINNEAIDTKEFRSLADAVEFFAEIKHLSVSDFLLMYKVFDK